LKLKFLKYNIIILAILFALSSKIFAQNEIIVDTLDLKITKLPSTINTEFSEFNPFISYDNYLYYSSYYPVNIDTLNDIFSSTFITEIFKVKLSSQGYGEKQLLSKRINDQRNHNANISLNKNNNIMYFVRCDDVDGSVGNCAIYKSEKSSSGNWSKATKLPDHINLKNSSTTQPFLYESREYNVLYFVSDRADGYGGTDIWYSIINDGEYSTPSNLGSNINTENNEMTPFYDGYTETLYFSSNGFPSLGGMDIYKSQGSLNSWTKVKNMGYPLNSPEDDLYFIINYNGEAYFSSNRKSASHPEGQEYCCSDLFYVKFNIKEEITELDSSEIIDTVEIININKINDLLPISLYFDNDIPNPGSKKITTDKNYKDLISDYINRKEKYKSEYSKGLSGLDSINAANEIEEFFSENVENSFLKLDTLANLLLTELDKGKTLNIKIKGYASPLNTSDYNEKLSRRRITSVINFLSDYGDGVFLKYLNANVENGGKLIIFQEPYGDTQASEFVSDNPNDKRNSVYSKAAALERKVEIMHFSIGNEENIEYAILNLPDSIDLGKIEKGKSKSTLLQIENKGKSDLVIDKIYSNCDCVEISKEGLRLEADEKSSIEIKLNLEYLKKDLEIIINSNSNNSPHRINLIYSISD
jgi:hypothetical protein